MNSKVKERLNYIKTELLKDRTQQAIALDLNLTRQAIGHFVTKYLPNWRDFKPRKERDINPRLTELQKEQHARFVRKRQNAKTTGYEWTLEIDDVVWPSHCPLLGIELDYFAPVRQENSVSFDRIDSNLGYIKGNVQIVSWRANRIKNDGTAEEHRKIADYLDTYPNTNIV